MTTRKRYTPDQKATILAAAQATTLKAAALKHGVSVNSIINWRDGKGGSKRPTDPQTELARLTTEKEQLARRSSQLDREIALLAQVSKALTDLAALRQGGAV